MGLSNEFNPDIRHPLYLIRQSLLKKVRQFAPKLQGKLLDFGCGSKPYKSLFSVEEYIGLDYENPGHSHANEQIDVFYDGKCIPFEDAHFDAVVASEVFEHVFHLDDTLREINRVMKPGAKMLITIPFVFMEHEIPHDYARYTTFGMTDALKRNGFKVLQMEKTSGFLEALGQMGILYLNHTFVGALRHVPLVGKYLRTACIAVLNIWAILLCKLLPARSEWYLGLAVLAEKESA